MEKALSLFPIFLLFAATLYMGTALPPFVSPDEFDHIERAYLLAQGQFLLETKDGFSSGGAVDKGLLEYMGYFTDLRLDPEARISASVLDEAARSAWTGEKTYETLPGTGYYFPVIYLPQATAIWIGQTLDLSIASTYQLVRLVTLGTGLFILGMAFQIVAPSSVVLALFSLPMMLFQTALPTIDFVTMALLALTLSQFLRFATVDTRASSASVLLFGACIVVIAGCRLHMAPLVLLPMFLGLKSRDARFVVLSVVLSVFIVAWNGMAVLNTVDLRITQNVPPAEILKFYISDPFAFVRVLWTTLTTGPILLHYWYSFLGKLGWLDITLNVSQYRFLGFLLVGIVLTTLLTKERQRNPAIVLTFFAVAISAVIIVFFSLLVSWTPHPAAFVHGVQGRYFLPIALILAYLTSATPRPSEASILIRSADTALLATLFAFSVLLVTKASQARYFEAVVQ